MLKYYPVRIASVRVLVRLWSSSVQSQMVQRGSNVLVVIVSSSVTHKKIKVACLKFSSFLSQIRDEKLTLASVPLRHYRASMIPESRDPLFLLRYARLFLILPPSALSHNIILTQKIPPVKQPWTKSAAMVSR
jgi:hypothetical protein